MLTCIIQTLITPIKESSSLVHSFLKITLDYMGKIYIYLKCLHVNDFFPHRFYCVFNLLLPRTLCSYVCLGLYFCSSLNTILKVLCQSQSTAHRTPFILLFLWTLLIGRGKKNSSSPSPWKRLPYCSTGKWAMFCPHASLETPVGSIHMETKSGIYVSDLEEQATVWYFCRCFFFLKKEKFCFIQSS